ncbi:MAG: phosphohydrolase, partial [Coriobacteriales bacterium]|nr:phosphohydrolase [Coriobacteriales bacterium]
KRENYQKIYGASEVNGNFSAEFGEVFSMMYDQVLQDLRDGREEAPVFRHHVRMVTEWLSYYGRTYQWQDDLDLTTVDYLSSMTDDYFVAYARALFPEKEAIFPSYTHF